MTGALYTVGWRVRGRPRRWLVNHFGSLAEAVRVARGNVRFDGGGRWRVYGMRLEVLPTGSAQSVRDPPWTPDRGYVGVLAHNPLDVGHYAGEARRAAVAERDRRLLALIEAGESTRSAAEAENVSQRTVQRWRGGRGGERRKSRER